MVVNLLLCSANFKIQRFFSSNEIDETGAYYTEWSKSERKTPIQYQFSSVQLLSRVQLFVTPWIAAHQASLSITNARSLPKLMSIELVMPSSHLILCCPLLLLPLIFPSNRVFSNESALHIRWPKYWSFSFNISPSNEHPGMISFRISSTFALFLRLFLQSSSPNWHWWCSCFIGDFLCHASFLIWMKIIGKLYKTV